MATFRHKQIVVEAVKASDLIRAAATQWIELPVWIRETYAVGGIVFSPTEMFILAPEGLKTARDDAPTPL